MVRQYRACVVNLLGLGIIVCVVYYCIVALCNKALITMPNGTLLGTKRKMPFDTIGYKGFLTKIGHGAFGALSDIPEEKKTN